VRRVTVALLAFLVLSSISVGAKASPKPDRWYFDLDLYVWLPTIDGQLNYDIPGSGDSLQVDPATILDDLQMTGMLGFNARKDRWSAFADLIYLDMADSKESSVPLSIGSDLELDVGAGLELKGLVVQMAGAYDVVRTTRAALGVLVGVRYFSMETDLAIQVDDPLPPELPTEEYSQKGELWDGIIGIKGHYGSRWYVSYYLDVGTGSSEITWQAMAGFGYRWHWGSVFATYRYLSFDEGEEKFIHALSFGGPAVGVSFRF
jgi:hypothetical protein